MVRIRYNNVDIPSSLITFTDIPNIISVTDSEGGTAAMFELTFTGNIGSLDTPAEGYYYITLLGETITSVDDYAKAINKNFYATTSTNTAASAARALRNCPTIAANFTIKNDANTVYLVARSVGGIKNTTVTTNLPSSGYAFFTSTFIQGTSVSSLNGSKITVDVSSNDEYITTLEKNCYGSSVAFDMSPLITTLAKHGSTIPYQCAIYKTTSDGGYIPLGNVGTNYVSVGYMCNQGEKFLPVQGGVTIAMNYNRGTMKVSANNTTLWVYEPTIPFSFYSVGNSYSLGVNVHYRYSDGTTRISETKTLTCSGSTLLKDCEIQLSQSHLSAVTYVDVEIPSSDTIRFNVIQPKHLTEGCTRILWRNSYGGISFFDFTGQRSETRKLETKTYNKNIYSYYTSPKNELEMIYDSDVDYEVTLKSHLFNKDSVYVFNDLMQSSEIWTRVNQEDYAIILENVSVDETDNNDIYEATVKYRYSQKPSLI